MHRRKVFAAALAGLIAISAVDIWVSHQVRQEQTALLETVSSARHETAQLYDQLGFGGLVHNFKNYLIRGDEAYLDTARTNAHSLLIRIERLQDISSELGLQTDLSAVHNVVTAYSDRLDVVLDGWENGLSVEEIDALVRVNDAPALEELNRIEDSLNRVMQAGMDRLGRLSTIQSIMTPMLQAMMLIFIIAIWARMYRTRLNAARQAQVQVANLDASLKAQTLTLERMQESNAALENFTAMVAHDLKAPLRQASMLLHLVKRAANDEDREKFFAQTRDSIERANTLVDSFLNLAQLKDQPPETSLENIGEIFRQAVDEIALLYRKAPRRIQIDDLGKAYCDPGLIRQVAINLLTNSLKYAPPGATLQVRVHATRSETMLTVYVEDNGVGIPPELADRIFSPLVRGEQSAQSVREGRGLGLALCQTIMAAHGGDIRVTPGYQRGASICFTLPLAQPDAVTL